MAQYIISKSLQADIDYIKRRADNIKKSSYEIAWKLYTIVQSPDFADSGYKNIVDLAADHFGFARSTTLNYVAIANKYLTTEFSGGKDKVITTTRARIGEDGKVTQDYAIGQLNALGKTTGYDFRVMDEEGIISPDMSADKIKEAVKKWYEPEEETEPEQEEETEPEHEPAEQEETYIHTLRELFAACVSEIVLFDEPEADEFENRNVCGFTVPDYINDIFRDLSSLKGVKIVFIPDESHEMTVAQLIDTDTGNVMLQYPDSQEVV